MGSITKNPEQVDKKERANRHYKTSNLPVFKVGTQLPPHKDELFKLYGEICSSWRMLTDVRFKLLGLVPTVSVVALLNILSQEGIAKGLSPITRTGIIAFGFLVTIALYIYDRRNTELYDDLISRARRIEMELGMDTGQFLGRKEPKYKLIKHDIATNLIYGTVLAGWLFAALVIWLN